MRRIVVLTFALALALGGCAVSPRPLPAPSQAGSAVATVVPETTPTAEATPAAKPPTRPTPGYVKWHDNTEVSHIFYHSLVVDPKRAFSKKNPMRTGYLQYMVTIDEFTKQLQSIYDKGYVLVQPTRLAKPDAHGVMRATPLYVPKGKKPLVLSIDDVSYYRYMSGAGFASKLVLNSEGKVVNTYTDAAGHTKQGAYDVSTVVDAFVAKHPDFSYFGDKGVIALTGYEGVLGYRSSRMVYGSNAKTRKAIADATAVATAMKAEGWSFASHSFGHISMTKKSLAAIKSDTRHWRAEVEPIVGRTPMLIFAFGADIQPGEAPYTKKNKKYAYLLSQGYRYLFPIDGSTPAWAQLTRGSLRQARINIDGISMQRALDGHRRPLSSFFTTKSVLDRRRPLPTPR